MALSKSTQRAKNFSPHRKNHCQTSLQKNARKKRNVLFSKNHLPNNLKSMITYCQIESNLMKTNKIKVFINLNLVRTNLYSLKLENVNEAQCECICPQTTGRIIKEGLSLSHPCLSCSVLNDLSS